MLSVEMENRYLSIFVLCWKILEELGNACTPFHRISFFHHTKEATRIRAVWHSSLHSLASSINLQHSPSLLLLLLNTAKQCTYLSGLWKTPNLILIPAFYKSPPTSLSLSHSLMASSSSSISGMVLHCYKHWWLESAKAMIIMATPSAHSPAPAPAPAPALALALAPAPTPTPACYWCSVFRWILKETPEPRMSASRDNRGKNSTQADYKT